MIGANVLLNGVRRLKVSFGLGLLLCSPLSFAALPPSPAVLPVLFRIQAPDARLPIRLERVQIHTEVTGSVAHSRVELTLFNPNGRVLEGELQFPLLDGQEVTGFALDINGELRAAVPVEKEKGQAVFEEVIRQRADPALLEKTLGNNYKLRVYPLPAQGSRRVVLELDEKLSHDVASYVTYRLPLHFPSVVGQLDVTVNNAAAPALHSAMAVRATLGATKQSVMHELGGRGSSVTFSKRNYSAKDLLKIEFPDNGLPLLATETLNDQTYFYAELPMRGSKPALRVAPKTVGLVWDASGSGAGRDHVREFALLDAYFHTLKNVDVALVLARDEAEAVQRFTIKNGDWSQLRKVLEGVAYDGATSVAALSPPKQTNLNLLFSDGLGNYAGSIFDAGDTPLFSVNAAVSHDLPRLRVWAERSGGRLLDLLSSSTADAVAALSHRAPYLAGMSSAGAKELLSTSVFGEGRAVQIAGILTEPDAVIELDWVDGQGVHQIQKVSAAKSPASTLVAGRWAAIKLAQLEVEYELNRAAILRLGKQFNRVTRETSLIVLDSLDDYVRYEIAPPGTLRWEYDRLLALKNAQEGAERNRHLDEVVKKFEQKQAWWDKSFPKGGKPKPVPVKVEDDSPSWFSRLFSGFGSGPRVKSMDVEMQANREVGERAVAASAMRVAPPPVVPMISQEQSGSASIRLKKWEPDAPYAKRLRAAKVEDMYRVYLDERTSYTNSTAFFLDVADIFIERGQTELGLRILSNLAEMNLEDRHILRILSYRLLQAKQAKLALPQLQRVAQLSDNEPQSWRDLGLAYAEDGQYQKAVDNLWEVVARPWHNRFPDIELIALAEMNAIIANAPKGTSIDTRRLDERLLRNQPVDIRAVLAWDSDNADIDLWVTDPNGEKVFYGNRLGYQGGRMSNDFTGGYGPEEFSLRNAKPGKYKVEAHFYGNRQQIVSGATTLMLRFSTGFGTTHQKDENVILRLTGQGADVEVGTFEVGK